MSVLFHMKHGQKELLKDFTKRSKDEVLQLENMREHEPTAYIDFCEEIMPGTLLWMSLTNSTQGTIGVLEMKIAK